MESEGSDVLRPQLAEAQETLRETLEQACRAEIYSADTGELIRIEEMLALADEAAKEAISIRRRLRREKDRAGATPSALRPGTATLPVSDASSPGTHRIFADARGLRWDACAIHPSASATARVRLPEPYQSGWISFDSAVEKRRLSPIPDGWESLSDDALRTLCDRAEIVPRRTPPMGRPVDGIGES
jgi:hypothetical protein